MGSPCLLLLFPIDSLAAAAAAAAQIWVGCRVDQLAHLCSPSLGGFLSLPQPTYLPTYLLITEVCRHLVARSVPPYRYALAHAGTSGLVSMMLFN